MRLVLELDAVGIDCATDDVLLNLVTKDTQLMQKTIPWRGPRKKDPFFFQMLIKSTMLVGDIGLDFTASTGLNFVVYLSLILCGFLAWISLLIFHTLNVGESIHACCKAGCHIVAIEGNKEIFKFLLEPFIVEPVMEVSKKQWLHKSSATLDDEEEALPIPKIVPCNRSCK
jgi:hypothetical protein